MHFPECRPVSSVLQLHNVKILAMCGCVSLLIVLGYFVTPQYSQVSSVNYPSFLNLSLHHPVFQNSFANRTFPQKSSAPKLRIKYWGNKPCTVD